MILGPTGYAFYAFYAWRIHFPWLLPPGPGSKKSLERGMGFVLMLLLK
jgi:hypothetical protein